MYLGVFPPVGAKSSDPFLKRTQSTSKMSSAIRSPLAEHNPPAKRALEEDPALNTVTAGQRVTRSKGLQYPSIASQGKRTLFGSLLALAEADSKDEDETEFTPEEEEEEIPEEYDESVIPEDERPPFEDDVMVSADPSLLADLAAEDEDEGGEDFTPLGEEEDLAEEYEEGDVVAEEIEEEIEEEEEEENEE